MTATAGTLARPRRSLRDVEGLGAWISLAVVVVVAAVAVSGWTDNRLLTRPNIDIILVTAVPLGLVGVGQTLVILAGHFDLSVAGVISLSVVTTAQVMDGEGSRVVPAVAVALAAGLVVGLVNGLIVTRLHVNALIATLGASLVIDGVLTTLVTSRTGAVSDGFRELGYGDVLTVPLGIYLLLAVFAAVAAILARTTFGHQLYAVGGSVESARMSGIRADLVTTAAFAASGFCAALAGVYLASRLGAGDPEVGVRGGYALESVAIVVLGGTVLGGGKGGVIGTLAGLLLFSVLDTAFNLLQIDTFLKSILEGGIIIAAVASYSLRSDRAVS